MAIKPDWMLDYVVQSEWGKTPDPYVSSDAKVADSGLSVVKTQIDLKKQATL